jgi:hypothetical protein
VGADSFEGSPGSFPEWLAHVRFVGIYATSGFSHGKVKGKGGKKSQYFGFGSGEKAFCHFLLNPECHFSSFFDLLLALTKDKK